MLCVVELMEAHPNLKSQISNLKCNAEGISRQLRGWANSLQNSDIPGQRHLTDQSRNAWDNRKRSETFRRQIQSSVEQAQQEREQRRETANPSEAERPSE
jgi:hypothetical protein